MLPKVDFTDWRWHLGVSAAVFLAAVWVTLLLGFGRRRAVAEGVFLAVLVAASGWFPPQRRWSWTNRSLAFPVIALAYVLREKLANPAGGWTGATAGLGDGASLALAVITVFRFRYGRNARHGTG